MGGRTSQLGSAGQGFLGFFFFFGGKYDPKNTKISPKIALFFTEIFLTNIQTSFQKISAEI